MVPEMAPCTLILFRELRVTENNRLPEAEAFVFNSNASLVNTETFSPGVRPDSL